MGTPSTVKVKPATALAYGIAAGYIVTANGDGSIPLNSRIIAGLDTGGGEAAADMLRRANAYPKLVEALRWLATMEAVEEERTERDEAAQWLEDELISGPVTARQLQASAKAAGLAWRTVQRAKNTLGVTSHREGFGRAAAYI